jgi:hypothetical protein
MICHDITRNTSLKRPRRKTTSQTTQRIPPHFHTSNTTHYIHNTMSSIQSNNDSHNPSTSHPEHHLHDEVDPLPGVNGATSAADYETSVENREGQQGNGHLHEDTHRNLGLSSTDRPTNAKGNTASNTEQPSKDLPEPPSGKLILCDKLCVF